MKAIINKLKSTFPNLTIKQLWQAGVVLWVIVALSQTGVLLGLVMAAAAYVLFLLWAEVDKGQEKTEDKEQ